MSKLQIKAFVYQLICFVILFVPFRYFILEYTGWTELIGAGAAFIAATILSPKFYAMKAKEGEKLFMKWLFMKGVKEI
jgi:hypothetical protein